MCSASACVGSAAPAAPTRLVFLAPVSERVSPEDDVFLSAVAAAASNGKPVVCAVDANSPWRPELLDYLRRYKPDRVVWLGPGPKGETPPGVALAVMAVDTALEGACKLATTSWRRSSKAVAYNTEDRACALSAAVLAARMRVPLFPCSPDGLPDKVQQCIAQLGVTRLLVVCAPAVQRPPKVRLSVEHLADALAVARRLARERLAVDYLAVAHPLEGGNGGVPRISLSAVLLAAGRGGAVVPLPFDTTWKRRFATGKPVARAPEGAGPSKAGHRVGMIEVHGTARAFAVGQDTANDRWWAQFDLNGDGRFDGPGEGPIRTGGVVAIGDTRYVVDLDVLENERGSAVWLTAPTPGDIVELIGQYRNAIGRDPRYLCLAGWPEAVPLAIAGNAQGTDADLVTDHPYAQTDADPFVDLAFARFVAEDVASGTLLACRSLTFDEISDRALAATYAMA
jgi:hypothetical protein